MTGTSRKIAFAPVTDSHTRVLILGSLPGDASLKAGQYYGHPQNAFWRLVGGLIEHDLAAMAYLERLETLKAAGIGLWDVVARAERKGSLDADIRNAEAADLRTLVRTLPKLRAIAFNGATAAKIGRRTLDELSGIALIDLPSSSPALAKPLAWKAQSWAVLREYLPPPA